ncbi:ferrous iron transport protein A [Flavobacterium agricola]|uniref:Ferrous iron transport protein A n=1 Tax=Flavobacterium agricola TaxID=2870839 RepID=A0ABY6LXP5_9FLAO|nr:FeoA family protein [Flavobacterium agricola]UYW00946.1 ferrous iron transport protein A [Flavobacterium agricola]
MKTLDTLSVNQKGIISDFDDKIIPLKLIEMGCFPGSEVTIIKKSILGCPIYLKINDTYLSIRKELAINISVETK